ncbi:ABC transporter ATP-binding protein [Nonomuraea endophytica]|uniref:ABC transporter ATP-binding protein n=1 Tax=Nonomuraea endophytica TaxID=714136 RepID=UPI0037CC8DFD
MSGLAVSGVMKAFGGTAVLRGAALDVADGDLAAVLGPSGCGKTTLLRIVAGFERAEAGSVRIGGAEVGGLAPEKRRVGIVPQDAALFPHLSVAGNVGFGLVRGLFRRAGVGVLERVEECLELVGLGGYGSRMPYQLSGGQQQRVALARALAPRPGVVLLDEPFNALDRSLRGTVRDDVRAALKKAGATAVLVTHDQEEALSMADTVAVMRDGVIVQQGTPEELYARPADLGVATFVGEAVVLHAEATNGTVTCALGSLRADGTSGTGGVVGRSGDASGTGGVVRRGGDASGTGGVVRRGSDASGTGWVALRPEQLVLERGGAARVERVEFFGHDAAVTVVLPDGGVVRARAGGEAAYRVGDRVSVRVEGPVLFFGE